jgi:hypothetical protein
LLKVELIQKDFRFKDQIRAASSSIMDIIAKEFR